MQDGHLKDSLHSSLIRSNPRVAIAVFNSTAGQGEGDAVYFEAEVSELEDKADIEHAITTLGKRVTKDEFRIKQADEVQKNRIWRIYKAIPIKVHKLIPGDWIDGQYVDRHVEINLAPSV